MIAHDPRIVYLDLNQWYILGLVATGTPRDPKHPAILAALQSEVDAGRLMVPPSKVTYLELTENERDTLRQQVADVMWRLSRVRTLAPVEKILDEEISRELHRRFGRPLLPLKVKKIGTGVFFAFGTPGRHRLVFDEKDRPMIEARLGSSVEQFEQRANAFLEYQMLATPQSLRDQVEGFDPTTTRKLADVQLASMGVMIDNLHGQSEMAKRPLEIVTARQLMGDTFENFSRGLQHAGFPSLPLRDNLELSDFVMHLPTQRVSVLLAHRYVHQESTKWKINHLRDIEALSNSIPYCEAVVTDRDACAAARKTRLDTEFDTAVFSQLTDLAAFLGL
jgi:hypothetical protein